MSMKEVCKELRPSFVVGVSVSITSNEYRDPSIFYLSCLNDLSQCSQSNGVLLLFPTSGQVNPNMNGGEIARWGEEDR